MESRKRKTMVLVDGKLPLPAGEDFAQQNLNRMDDFQTQMERNYEDHKTQMEGLKTQVEGLKTQVEGIKTQMQEINQANQAHMRVLLAPLAIQTAKNANRSLALDEALVQVPNNQGDLPVNLVFPRPLLTL
jgi:phage shock protein A